MIIIRVELWSALTGQKTELARMVIDNIGGTANLGDYRCRTLRGRSEESLDRSMQAMRTTGTQREGRVLRHPRLREHVWNLVAKSLSSMGYGQTKAKAEELL
ncbi:hypothetical protein [Novosphingobium sp.]|uniref:hypothetical protein n=1 Tax=Novosphingobium sp. TaxID=1874826 RepID=UPI00262A3D51|nr:hypothetical protein [Novosphingobium sp.]